MTKIKIKVIFICNQLTTNIGGLERKITEICNHLSNKYQIYLITNDQKSKDAFYPINKNVTWIKIPKKDISKKSNIFDKIKKLFLYRNVIKKIKPNYIVCFQSGPFHALSIYLSFIKKRLILCERESPYQLKEFRLSNFIRMLFLFNAHKIIVQFDEYKKYFPNIYRDKIFTIHNDITNVTFSSIKKKKITFLSVGRLEKVKNYFLLIDACKLIPTKYDYELTILGEGSLQKTIEKYIKNNSLENKIKLIPNTTEINNFYTSSKYFISTSINEGFPNALAEALKSGLPCIGLENCDGVNILIKDKFNGFLIQNNRYKIRDIIIKLINMSDIDYKKFSSNARNSVKNYTTKKMIKEWEKILKN